MKYTEHYTSSMKTHVRFHIYVPKVVLRLKGVIQLHHGIGEHADHYEHFASFLTQHGFVVIVSDFVGHGQSLIDFEQGYFGVENGSQNLVKDMFHLFEIIRERYPDIPYFLLGVDLGSLLIRKFVCQYGDFIDGIILLGTPAKVEHKYLKRIYLSILKCLKGPAYKDYRYFYRYHHHWNKKILQNKSEIGWLTSDHQERKKFLRDPMNHFAYTVQGYRDIVHLIEEVNSDESIQKIPVYLPIYVGVGALDPMTYGIDKLIEKYKKRGIRDLTYQVFSDCRHAILFEKNKKEVYQHILNWLNERTYL